MGRNYSKSLNLICLLLIFSIYLGHAQEASSIVYEDGNGCLRYVADAENNYIPDFSYAGYKNGEAPIPEIAVVKTIAPIAGDNTAHIQAALNAIAAMPPDENGFRGALLLEAGIYEIHGTVVIRGSGMVLRGVGDGSDPANSTILQGIGNTPAGRDIVQLGNAPGASWTRMVPGTKSTVTSVFVPAGSRSLQVTAPELYSAGDNVIIRHPSTNAWLASINYGDTDVDAPWTAGDIDLFYNRYITAVDLEESKITLDAPVYDHLDTKLSTIEVYVHDKTGIQQNIGIENLRIDIQTDGEFTENHARNAIRLIGVEDSWVTGVTALHFVYAGIDTRIASRVTIRDCWALEPHSLIEGARRYNFAVGNYSNQILFEDCHASKGRHSFVSNGTSSVSGIVFYNSTSQIDYSSSEGHRRWSQGMLFDNISFSRPQTNTLLGLYNRGSFGTGHGWSLVHGVAWNVQMPIGYSIKLQKPPGRQNYAIACRANVTNAHTFPQPIGYAELTNQEPLITSLYTKQFEQRQSRGVPPDAPAKLVARQISQKVELQWLDIAARETGYRVEWSTDGGVTYTEIAQLPPDATSFSHDLLPDSSGVTVYRVFAVGNDCPSPYSNPAIPEIVEPVRAAFWEQHWIDQNYVFSGSGGDVLTVTQTDCEEGRVVVTDPLGTPLPSFSPIIINPKDSSGEAITDISSFPLRFTLRARSAEEVVVGALFRSDDGTADFRTSILYDTIPAGLDEWTEISMEFTGDDLGGFNAENLRDFWFFLDRGTDNFAGNEFYIDYIALGGAPTANLESPCVLGQQAGEAIFADYYTENNLLHLSSSSIAGQVSTYTLDTICETVQISVTDPANNPLPPFNAYQVKLHDEVGQKITDITGNVNVSMRVRSAEAVTVDILFRSGAGDSDGRTDIKSVSIPAGLADWTSFTMEFTESELAGFNPADLRDMWFYLDRGTENFAGNEFYIDHIVIGGTPDDALLSPCDSGTGGGDALFAEYFQDSLHTINTGSTAGQVSTFTLDTLCETLQISVTDPATAPLPSFNAYQVNPIDANGEMLTDISDNVNVTMRVRSVEAVNIDILFRSGGGSMEERTDRKQVRIPGGLEDWTTFTITFGASELAGFNPADLRDMWFYLDRGTPNFAGNVFFVDHIIIGGTADPTLNSPCSTEIQPQTWLENWNTDQVTPVGGTETEKLTLTQTECEELKIEVTDPEGDPHLAFRPLIINPIHTNGSEIRNIAGNVQLVIRARSAAEVPVGVLFRSGDGSADFRTSTLTQNLPGNLDAWTTLTYTFTGDDLGGFDPEDLVDCWIYLDRENNNFPGNAIYFDYIAIGEQPDSSLNSPCTLPDTTVATRNLEQVAFFTVYPNPVSDQLEIRFDPSVSLKGDSDLRVYDALGRLLLRQRIPALQKRFTLEVSDWPDGVLYLQIDCQRYRYTKRVVKK